MTRTMVLHIGLMKTGTTYLQQVLSSKRADLGRQGWLYPGRRMNQQHEMYYLCGSAIPWVSARRAQQYAKIAEILLADLNESGANVVLSCEALSSLDERGIAHVIERIGRPDSVVLTLRNLGRLIPSAWGQYVKSGGTMSLDEFIEELRRTRCETCKGLWRTYAYGKITRMWSSVSGAPVDLVVVPKRPEGPQQLWDLFRAAMSLPKVDPGEIGPKSSNRSLSREMTEVLRHYNETLKAIKRKKYRDAKRREFLNKYILPVSVLGYGRKIELTERHRAMIRSWNAEESRLAFKYARRLHGNVKDLEDE